MRFATQEEVHDVAIDHANVLQIQNDVAVVHLAFKQSLQLGYRRCFDSATQDEYCASTSLRSLNPESHRSGHLTQIAVAAVPHCNLPSEYRCEQCNRLANIVANGTSLKTGFENEIGVTESWEVPEFWELNEGNDGCPGASNRRRRFPVEL